MCLVSTYLLGRASQIYQNESYLKKDTLLNGNTESTIPKSNYIICMTENPKQFTMLTFVTSHGIIHFDHFHKESKGNDAPHPLNKMIWIK